MPRGCVRSQLRVGAWVRLRTRLRLLKCDPTRRVAEHEPKIDVDHTTERVDQDISVVPVFEQEHVLRGRGTISAFIMNDLGDYYA